MNFKSIWTLVRETLQDWSEDKAPRLAAALSYYTIFSLAPLLVLVIAITGFIIGNNADIRQQVIAQVQSLVGEEGAGAVETLISNTNQPERGILATVLGVFTLLLGATGLFGQLQDALNTIWEVEPKKAGGIMEMIKDRFLSFTMVLGVSFLLLVSLVISATLSMVNTYFTNLFGGAGFLAQTINIIVSLGTITLIFALIYKVLPDVTVQWRDVWIGALVTAILFTIGKQLISLYLARSAPTSAYGAAGSLVILLLWVYYSAQILFLGAEFTQVYARHHGSRIAPTEKARKLTETERAQQGIPRRMERMEQLQGAMMPITGQPEIHPTAGKTFAAKTTARERVRHEPPEPGTVVPVIAGGALAGAYTLTKVAQKVYHTIRGRGRRRR